MNFHHPQPLPKQQTACPQKSGRIPSQSLAPFYLFLRANLSVLPDNTLNRKTEIKWTFVIHCKTIFGRKNKTGVPPPPTAPHLFFFRAVSTSSFGVPCISYSQRAPASSLLGSSQLLSNSLWLLKDKGSRWKLSGWPVSPPRAHKPKGVQDVRVLCRTRSRLALELSPATHKGMDLWQ